MIHWFLIYIRKCKRSRRTTDTQVSATTYRSRPSLGTPIRIVKDATYRLWNDGVSFAIPWLLLPRYIGSELRSFGLLETTALELDAGWCLYNAVAQRHPQLVKRVYLTTPAGHHQLIKWGPTMCLEHGSVSSNPRPLSAELS